MLNKYEELVKGFAETQKDRKYLEKQKSQL